MTDQLNQLTNPVSGNGNGLLGGNGRDPLSPTPSGVSFASISRPRLVTFQPNQLLFPPQLDNIITNTLTIRALESDVTWKLYHNAPHRYTVVPNTGVLKPREKVSVEVSYRPRHLKDGGTEDSSKLVDDSFHLDVRTKDETDRVKYKVRCVFTEEGVARQNSSISRKIENVRKNIEREEDVMRRTGTLPNMPPTSLSPPLPLAICLLLAAFILGRLCVHMSTQLTDCIQ